MSILRRLWQSIRSPSRFVGKDLEGNRFYEHPSSVDDPRRTKRTVQYSHPDDVWNYIGGGKRLPVQWSAWLTHTRPHPPTLEELQVDLARQHRVLMNAAAIEARDQEERAQTLRLAAAPLPEGAARLPATDQGNPPASDLHAAQPSSERHAALTSPLPKMATETFEPQSWTPQTRFRRSSK